MFFRESLPHEMQTSSGLSSSASPTVSTCVLTLVPVSSASTCAPLPLLSPAPFLDPLSTSSEGSPGTEVTSDEMLLSISDEESWLNTLSGAWSDMLPSTVKFARLFLSFLVPISSESTPMVDTVRLEASIQEVCDKYSTSATEAAAEADANHFELPPEVLSRDTDALHAVASLSDLVRSRQLDSAASRFNPQRCRDCFSQDPEFSTLMAIATEGARIDVSPTFVRQSVPDPPRQITRRIPHTILKHACKLWSSGNALILPLTDVQHLNPHFNNIHWCPKPGAPAGRFLGDCSNRQSGDVLNSREAKTAIIERYGDLRHPTIVDLVRLIFRVADKAGGLDKIKLWKEDISGAFSQYNHYPEEVILLSFQITLLLVLIYLVGMFGWTGSPFVFAVFSRAFSRQANATIAGELEVYVDDFMAASPSDKAAADQQTTQRLVVNAFGPDGINLSKSVLPSRCTDFIGWLIDLDLKSVRPNQKGIEKIVMAFFSFDMDAAHPLRTYQVLASLACRYSRGIIGMRPFVQPLYAMTRGFHRSDSRRSATSPVKLTIGVWRAVGLALLDQPSSLAVPLSSLIRDPSSWEFYIISDAGPFGLGLAIYSRTEEKCLAHISYRLPFDASDPKFQNAREFQGLILGHIVLHHLGIRHKHIQWRGDNVAALSWARKESCRSSATQASFLLYSWISILSGNQLVRADHQAGTSMGDIDSLSRFYETQFSEDTNVSPDLQGLDEVFSLCDPTLDSPQLEQHVSLLCRIMRLLHRTFPSR
jgi:hypothetical protein